MNSYYDALYLSPHLDDAALSCGGQIFLLGEQGKSVLIVTVMAGDRPGSADSSYIQELHDRWQIPSDVVAGRRSEDKRACRILGADHLHLDIPDCIYRFHPLTNEPLYLSDPHIFGVVHPSEADLIKALSAQIQSLPAHKRLVVPLAVGNHVDHQITRLAAEESGSARLIYYEEYPYADDPHALQAAAQRMEGSWEETLIPLSEAALEAKIKAIACYESQLSTFFTDRAHMANAVRRFTSSVGGERLWHRVAATS